MRVRGLERQFFCLAADGFVTDAVRSVVRNTEMWINLTAEEISLILTFMPDSSVAKKLRAPVDPDDQAFLNAVETSDDLEVDPDAVVSRSEDGAFVMSWIWVSNVDAGVDPAPVDEDLDKFVSNPGTLS